jgi:hypothetical protein
MNRSFVPLFLLLFPFYLAAQIPDTTIKGVKVTFNYSVSIFPADWQQAPINAYGEKLLSEEVQRTKQVATKALSKYPVAVLQTNLAAVYFLKQMKFYDVGYGGTNSDDALFLTNNGIATGYTDKYLEQTFHHEFSSILFRNYPALLDTNKWKNANYPGFNYNDPENGVGAIRNNQSSQALDTLFSRKGMLTQYAASSIENDVNTFAQNLFCPEENFWLFVNRYEPIRRKTILLISFYNKINPEFTEQYFRKLKTQ